jgi:hypothetical protein
MNLRRLSITILIGRRMSKRLRKHLVKTDLQLKSEKRRDESLIDGAISKVFFNLEQDLGHSVLRCHILDIVIRPSDFNAWKSIPAMRVVHGWNFT